MKPYRSCLLLILSLLISQSIFCKSAKMTSLEFDSRRQFSLVSQSEGDSIAIVAFSPDGKLMATRDYSASRFVVDLWNAHGVKVRRLSFTADSVRNDIIFSPDSRYMMFWTYPLVTRSGESCMIYVADLKCKIIRKIKSSGVVAAQFTDSGRIAGYRSWGSENFLVNEVILWDIGGADTKKVMSWTARYGCEFAPGLLKGKYLVEMPRDRNEGPLRVLSLDGRPVREKRMKTGAILISGGNYIAVVNERGPLRIYDEELKLLDTLPQKKLPPSAFKGVYYNQNGKTAAFLKPVRIHSGRLMKVSQLTYVRNISSKFLGKIIRDKLDYPVVSPDESTLALIKEEEDRKSADKSKSWRYNTLILWNLNRDKLKSFMSREMSDVLGESVISGNGRIIANVNDELMAFWDIRAGKALHSFRYNKIIDGSSAIALSPDGGTLAVCAGFKVHLLNSSGKPIKSFRDRIYSPYPWGVWRGKQYSGFEYSPDGKRIRFKMEMTNDRGDDFYYLKIWNLQGKVLVRLKGELIEISQDWDRIAVVQKKFLMIYDGGGRLIEKKRLTGYTTGLGISPDGRQIATVSSGYLIDIWDREGRLIKRIMPHIYFAQESEKIPPAESVQFSSDGKKLLIHRARLYYGDGTGHAVGTSLWDVERGLLVKILFADANYYQGEKICFTRGDREIVFYHPERNYLSFYDMQGRRIRQDPIPFADASVKMKTLTRDGKYLLGSDRVSRLHLYHIASKSMATLASDRDDWIIYTPDGYFDGSPHCGRLLAMVKGYEAYNIDRFAFYYNRPDIILGRLEMGNAAVIAHYHSRYLSRLKKAGMTEKDLSGQLSLPDVKILKYTGNVKGKDGMGELVFQLSDPLCRLRSYHLFVNEVPLYGYSGKPVSGRKAVLSEKIVLTGGSNKIEVSCVNERGVEYYRAVMMAYHEVKRKGDLYFLGFGVSEYKNRNLNLKYAHKDVLDLAKVFQKMGKKYGEVRIRTYVNEQVTAESIKKAASFLKQAGVDDTVVLMIAGHGVHDTDKNATYYYLTHETDIDNLKGSAVNFELIESLLDGLKSRRKIFFMDTCESGEADDMALARGFEGPDSRRIKARSSRAFVTVLKDRRKKGNRDFLFRKERYIYNNLVRRTGAVVVSSSMGGELSYESDQLKNGFFTREIINALKGRADLVRDGVISLKELKDYVKKTVPKKTRGRQHPAVDRDNLSAEFAFPIVR